MKRKALWIALAVLGILAISTVALAATAKGQMALALGSLPAGTQTALRSVTERWLPDAGKSFESWTTVNLTAAEAPGLNFFARKVLQATQAQADVCYDKAASAGAAQLRLLSGGVPLISLSAYLQGGAVELESPELLDRPVRVVLDSLPANAPSAEKLTLLAAKALWNVPGQAMRSERRELTLLGQPRQCAAVIVHLQGDALADVLGPVLQAVAADADLRQTFHALGADGDGSLLAVSADPQALRQRLRAADMTLTTLRLGLQPVGLELDWREPGVERHLLWITCRQGAQADLRLTMTGWGDAVDAAVLQTADGQGALNLQAQATLGQTGWLVTADSRGAQIRMQTAGRDAWNLQLTPQAQDTAKGRHTTAFDAAFGSGGLRLQGSADTTTAQGAADIAAPDRTGDAVLTVENPLQLLAALGRLAERLRVLSAGLGIRTS